MGQRYRGQSVSIEFFGDDIAKAVVKANEPALWAAGQILKREAASRAPKRSGRLADSGYVQSDRRSDYQRGPRDRKTLFRKRGEGVLVAFAVFYANLFEDSGVRAHRIPRTGFKVMRIPGVGLRASAKHPGMRARPFLGPALEAKREAIGEALVSVLADAIEGSVPRAE